MTIVCSFFFKNFLTFQYEIHPEKVEEFQDDNIPKKIAKPTPTTLHNRVLQEVPPFGVILLLFQMKSYLYVRVVYNELSIILV